MWDVLRNSIARTTGPSQRLKGNKNCPAISFYSPGSARGIRDRTDPVPFSLLHGRPHLPRSTKRRTSNHRYRGDIFTSDALQEILKTGQRAYSLLEPFFKCTPVRDQSLHTLPSRGIGLQIKSSPRQTTASTTRISSTASQGAPEGFPNTHGMRLVPACRLTTLCWLVPPPLVLCGP